MVNRLGLVFKSIRLMPTRGRTRVLALNAVRVVLHLLDVIGLAAVGFLGALLATGLTENSGRDILGFRISVDNNVELAYLVATMAGVFALKSVFSAIVLRKITATLAEVESQTAAEIAEFVFSNNLSGLRRFSHGDIQWAVGSSAHHAFTSLNYAFSTIVSEAALFAVIFVVFLVVDPVSAVFIGAYFAGVFGVFQWLISRKLREAGDRLKINSVRVSNSLLSLQRAFKEIAVAEAIPFYLEQVSRGRRLQAHDEAKQRFLLGVPRFFVEVSLMVGILGLLLIQIFSGYLVDGLSTAGIFLAGGLRMMAALLPLQNAIGEIKFYAPQSRAALELLEEIRLREITRGSENQESPRPGSTSLGIQVDVKNLSFSYPSESSTVLDGITFSVPAGSKTAIIGDSGAGKSTLVDLILGLLHPSDGYLKLDGLDPADARKAFSGQISYVAQDPGILPATLAENIALGAEKSDISESKVLSSLDSAHLADFVNGLSDGIWSSLGQQSEAISGGQRQRLGLARALYQNPRLVILDEATSALDAETESLVTESIARLGNSTTVIIVAHRLSTIVDADQVIFLDSGKVAASGSFEDLLTQSEKVRRYAELLGIRDAPPSKNIRSE